jgi:hypothetical protein
MDRHFVFSAWYGFTNYGEDVDDRCLDRRVNRYVRNIVVCATSASRGAISTFAFRALL